MCGSVHTAVKGSMFGMHICTIDDLCKSDEALDDVDLYIDLLHRAIILDYLMQIQCMRFEDAALMI